MEKLDLTKQYKTYYTAKTTPEIVEIEQAQFLSITGKGDPSGKEFAQRIEALYSTAYAIKFVFKSEGKDFIVPKLEGLWWFDEKKYTGLTIIDTSSKVPREEWEYKLLIRLPDFVTNKEVNDGIKSVISKKQIPVAGRIELFQMNEGKSVQILHIGPFSTEVETLQKISAFVKEKNLLPNGHHHEIYLSDFRKTASDKLKTILREPVK
jgi:hypothetical protein